MISALRRRVESSRSIKCIRNLGFFNYFHLRLQNWRMKRPNGNHSYRLLSRHSCVPLRCRANTSDILVFDQIFIELEYRSIRLRDPKLILDCGANVGYSSAYFLSCFPTAAVVAIEPDIDNFRVLEANLKPFGTRVRTLHSAIWSHPTRLTMAETTFRDGSAWARHVRESQIGEQGFEATDIGSILKECKVERISLLKMDIEGAEAVVFSSGFETWLGKVDNIAIELHEDGPFGDGRAAFLKAIEGRGFVTRTAGELMLCSREY
jgi:FkbM family methyltransferase